MPNFTEQTHCLQSDTPHAGDCSSARHIWSDLELQLQHSICCRSAQERELLVIADQKLNAYAGTSYGKYWRGQKAWSKYDITASVIACSSYAKREALICCGDCSFSCGDRLLCPRCCYRRLTAPLLDEFRDSHAADREVWYLVFSLSADPYEHRRFVFRDFNVSDVVSIKASQLAQPCSRENYGVPFNSAAIEASAPGATALIRSSIGVLPPTAAE